MDVTTIKSDAPRCPSDRYPKLLPHQLAELRVMLDLERNCARLEVGDATLSTRIGLLGDKVGSGKSYTVTQLLMEPTHHLPGTTTYTEYLNMHMTVSRPYTHRSGRAPNMLGMSMLVVPHNLVKQWVGVIDHMVEGTGVEYMVVSKTHDVEAAKTAMCDSARGDAAAPRFLLVSAPSFPAVLQIMRRGDMTMVRAVFDEADNLDIKRVEQDHLTMSRFTWFISASTHNLLPGQSTDYRMSVAHSNSTDTYYMGSALSCAKSKFIRNFFRTYYRAAGPFFGRVCVVADNAFVDESLRLEDPVDHEVRCQPPFHTSVLTGIAPQEVVRRLNAGDIEQAIAFMNPNRADVESNIIAAALSRIKTALDNAHADVDHVSRYTYTTADMRDSAMRRAQTRVEALQRDYDNITDRIKNATSCMICYDDITNKTIVPCCQNSFCLACISGWVAARGRHAACPMCRRALATEDFMVCCDGPVVPRAATESLQRVGDVPFDASCSKDHNLKLLIRHLARDSGRKILFFSDNDYVNQTVAEPAMREAGVGFGTLKGNISCIDKRLRDFKNASETRALLINCRHYGCGMDLSTATDLILYHKIDARLDQQVIGRAQRPPRRSRLRIWRLVNVDEA